MTHCSLDQFPNTFKTNRKIAANLPATYQVSPPLWLPQSYCDTFASAPWQVGPVSSTPLWLLLPAADMGSLRIWNQGTRGRWEGSVIHPSSMTVSAVLEPSVPGVPSHCIPLPLRILACYSCQLSTRFGQLFWPWPFQVTSWSSCSSVLEIPCFLELTTSSSPALAGVQLSAAPVSYSDAEVVQHPAHVVCTLQMLEWKFKEWMNIRMNTLEHLTTRDNMFLVLTSLKSSFL